MSLSADDFFERFFMEELTTREEMAIEKAKKMFRLHDYKFEKDDQCNGVNVLLGRDRIILDQNTKKKHVKFKLN